MRAQPLGLNPAPGPAAARLAGYELRRASGGGGCQLSSDDGIGPEVPALAGGGDLGGGLRHLRSAFADQQRRFGCPRQGGCPRIRVGCVRHLGVGGYILVRSGEQPLTQFGRFPAQSAHPGCGIRPFGPHALGGERGGELDQ